jgi:nicotinamidase-related amidase
MPSPRPASETHHDRAVRRIAAADCVGVIVDVQEFFLSQVGNRMRRSRIESNTMNLVRLLGYFRVPIVATLERPLYRKGDLPKGLKRCLGEQAQLLEKDFFDLTKEKRIASQLARMRKKQAIVAGCETDVCVLQSCLGLLGLGYEVYVVEDLLFSSARNIEAAVKRMQAEGAILLTYKSLYYELVEAVDGGPHGERMLAAFGEFPEDLPDRAA